MEFETHEDAYSFYKDYAKSVGFGTAKLSSRRSRASKEFIDAKFSCIRYGSKQQSDDAINPRASPKIGCKASMHVKRRPDDGKWYVYSFVKEHNHELLPDQAHFFRSHRNNNDARLRRKKNNNNPSGSCEHLSAYQDLSFIDGFMRNQHDKGRRLVLSSGGDSQILLEFLMRMQEENPNFFFAVDFSEDHMLRNVFWVDAKGIEDYKSFSDVVSFDTTYLVGKYKIPLVVFVGVNHHVQPVLLGCGLVADETVYTYVWLMQTWLVAMGGQAPKVMLTDQSNAVKAAIAAVLPDTRHCYCLWHVLNRLPRNLDYWSMWQETWQDTFMKKFFKCIYKSWSEVEFDKRWLKLIDKFHLRDVQWMRSLYEERKFWAPTFMRGVTFAGLSPRFRSETVNSLFDRYVQSETSLREFLEGYGVMLEDRYEEEAKADFDAWHEAPELKSPSPFEKQMLLVYTHEIFRKFQVEVLGAAACHLTKESEEGTTYSVKDFEDDQKYLVDWNESKSDIYCSCRSFEYKGYLCRHAIVVLQMSGVFTIPTNYVLQRWTNAARNRHQISGNLELVQSNIRRLNDLCRRAIILGEEGSLSQESYDVAMFAMKEAFKQCAIKVSNTIELPAASCEDAAAIQLGDPVQENQYGSTSKQIVPEPNIHIGNAQEQAENRMEKRSCLNSTSKKAKHVTQSGTVGEGNQEGLQHMAAPRTLQPVMSGQYHNTMPSTVFQNVMSTEFHKLQATNMHESNLPGVSFIEIMSKQEEETSDSLAFTGIDLSQQRYVHSSPSFPVESQRIIPSAQPPPPPSQLPLESESYNEYSAPPYAPSPTFDDCHSPQLLESEYSAPPYAPSPTSYGCRSPQPQSFEPQPLTFGDGLPPLREGECYAPSRENYVPYTPPSEPPLPCYKVSRWDYGPFLSGDWDLRKYPSGYSGSRRLLGQIGLHGYNLHKGTNLQFVGVQYSGRTGLFSTGILLQAEDPISNSTCKLQTDICYTIGWSNRNLELHVTECILNPPEGEGRQCPEKLIVDGFFEGDLPDWMPEDALTGSYKLQYYEMEESEVEENKEWLYPYCELVLLADCGYYQDEPKPIELRKIVVQTKEDVEPKKKVKAWNAIFYISFKRSDGQDFKAIIRRTSVYTPGFITLCVKYLK